MTAVIVIAGLTALTIAVAALVLAPRFAPQRIRFELAPDRPRAFGEDMCWLAIRSSKIEAVVEALGITDAVPANWSSGLGTVYDPVLGDRRVFVAPPVNGWIFVASVALPLPASHAFVDKVTPLIAELGARFPAVRFFAAFPIIDLFAWARVDHGRLTRAFAIGDDGVVWDRGKLTTEERALGLRLFDLRGIRSRRGDVGGAILLHPTTAHVLQVARGWGRSPDQLCEADAASGTGLIGTAPLAWRAERRRKAA